MTIEQISIGIAEGKRLEGKVDIKNRFSEKEIELFSKYAQLSEVINFNKKNYSAQQSSYSSCAGCGCNGCSGSGCGSGCNSCCE